MKSNLHIAILIVSILAPSASYARSRPLYDTCDLMGTVISVDQKFTGFVREEGKMLPEKQTNPVVTIDVSPTSFASKSGNPKSCNQDGRHVLMIQDTAPLPAIGNCVQASIEMSGTETQTWAQSFTIVSDTPCP